LGAISVPGSNGSAATAVKLNFAGVSQLSTTSNASVTNQNGVAPGTLQSYAIGTDGTITGTFSNGLTQTLGQVALAQFSNPSGLLKQGNNLLQATANSGTPQVGTAGANGLGSVNAGYLEQSNVDLTTQFSNMIISQSAFQANTKVVTTVDQMLQEVMQMKQ
jgi:flagellar hook protein FlgE